jgi:hypothetical protein
VQVIVDAGGLKAVGRLKVTGKKPEAKPEVRPEFTLEVTTPGDVVLQPGEIKYVEVRVTAKGVPAFDTDPAVKLEGLAEDRVKCEVWSASTKANPPSYARGYALKAAADAPAEEKEVRVLVSLGSVTTAGKFKVAVKPADARVESKP